MTLIGTFFILVLATGSSWAVVSVMHRLRRNRYGIGWWVALAALMVLGVSTGIWCAFGCGYHWRPNYRVGGFPLPLVFFHLEDGNWVDFPVPRIQAWATAFADIISITALATLPVWVLSWKQHTHELKNPEEDVAASAR